MTFASLLLVIATLFLTFDFGKEAKASSQNVGIAMSLNADSPSYYYFNPLIAVVDLMLCDIEPIRYYYSLYNEDGIRVENDDWDYSYLDLGKTLSKTNLETGLSIVKRIHNDHIRARGILELAIIQAKNGNISKAKRLAQSIRFLKIKGEILNSDVFFDIGKPNTWGLQYDELHGITSGSVFSAREKAQQLAKISMTYCLLVNHKCLKQNDLANAFRGFHGTVIREIAFAQTEAGHGFEALNWVVRIGNVKCMANGIWGILEGLLGKLDHDTELFRFLYRNLS